ncbi:hypothetical protein [Mycolicibacterium mengxianglii]|uniref:hypothetical protein n=1 Tax=Mycolicibacterium mengxianglii TaxID=2736649 RepID=UPI0018EECDC5|nr:hypothetical protein [Mycolicibacterium mengxianglii]
MPADEPILLRPLPSALGVQVHPHADGDVVSIVWVDMNGGRYLLATDPDTAHQLGTDLLTATTDPDIAAQADQLRDLG